LITEWYVNGPAGLEQGFTIDRRPKGVKGPLTIALGLSGELSATADDGRTGLKLADKNGRERMRYTGLSAYDAGGKELRASLELQGQKLLLRVEDAGARYPLLIDPIVQLAKLTSSDGGIGGGFGLSVAISGNVIVVGTAAGQAAYVFVKPGTGWQDMTQTAELRPSVGVAAFGLSVAMSGNIIIVGAPGANQNQGAAYAFVKPRKGWHDMTETATLVASDGVPGDNFGRSVSVAGNTAIIGALDATVDGNPYQGAAYVYTQPAHDWANIGGVTLTETAKLTASDGAQQSYFGTAVSINGETAAVGAHLGNGGLGEAYVFEEPQSGWTNMTKTAQLLPPQISGDLGSAVAIDATGDAVAAGSPLGYGNADNSGEVYVFLEPTGGWQTTSKPYLRLFSLDGQGGDQFGFSVALGGQTLVAVAPVARIGGNRSQGAAYVFGTE
jgi:hypothetical protein